jgi:hypothetical protein
MIKNLLFLMDLLVVLPILAIKDFNFRARGIAQ